MSLFRLCAGTVIVAIGLAAAGCGLISSDIKDFDLALKDKTFSVDASGWQIDQTAANAYLAQTCDPSQPAPNVCSSAASTACPMNCTGSCDATAQTCDLALNVGVYRAIDLLMEHPELSTINNEPVIKVTIDDMTYTVTSNTLNVDTPPMTVFVAPASVMDPTDPQAQAIGTIDAVPAGQTTAETTMTYTPNGKQALIDIMGTYRTPFNVIVGSTLTVRQGDPVPTGKLDASVTITAHASL